MGCFIVCLGFSKKRKRRIKPSNKLISGDQVYGSYRHLDSQDVTLEESAISESDCSSQAKVNSSIKIKKKVTFNLNVKIYEPIPDEASDKELEVENDANKDKESASVSYPPNCRYQNLRDSWDDEEEDEESDDLDDDDDDDDWEENEDDDKEEEEEEEICGHLCCLSVESEEERATIEGNDREREQYKCSVLNPVENLSQWREVKEKSKKHLILKMQSTKENMGMIMMEKKQEEEIIRQSLNCKLSSPLMQDIAIDASLSHWVLASSAREFAQQC